MSFLIIIITVLVARNHLKYNWLKSILLGIVVSSLVEYVSGLIVNNPIIPLLLVFGGVWAYKNSPKKQWINIGYDDFINSDEELINFGKIISSNQTYGYGEIPIGRASAFLSDIDEFKIETITLLGYTPIASSEDSDFTEYGSITTSQGIVLKYQTQTKERKEEANGKIKKIIVNHPNPIEIPFSGLYSIQIDEDRNIVKFSYYDRISIHVDLKKYPIHKSLLQELNQLVENGLTRNLYFEDKAYQLTDEKHDHVNKEVEKAYKILEKKSKIGIGAIEGSLAGATFPKNNSQSYNDISQNMNDNQFTKMTQSRQGHGEAAEYANNTFDAFKGFKTESTGGNFNVNDSKGQGSNAHDRIRTNRFTGEKEFIQTKYCENANATYRSFMEKDYPEGTVLEVPRGQGDKVKDRLREGGRDDVKVIEGVSYSWAKSSKEAGTIESLTVDIASGAIESVGSAGITFVISYAQARHLGLDVKEALKEASKTGLITLGSGTIMRVGASQFVKSEFGKNLANKIGIKSTELAGRLSTGVTLVVVYAPTITNYLTGYTSGSQFAKDFVVSTSGLAGGIAGAKLGSRVGSGGGIIGTVGGAVGGMAAGYGAQKIMDNIIEDDRVETFRLYKEEFIDYIYQLPLSESEFEMFFDKTLRDKKFNKRLKEIYKVGKGFSGIEKEKLQREYINENLLEPNLIKILKEREVITDEEVEYAYQEAIGFLIGETPQFA